MKILFVSSLSSSYSSENSSYMQRLTFLKEGLENLGVETDIIYLGDYIFGKPAILSPFVVNKLKNEIYNYDFIHAGGVGSAYAISVIKKLFNLKINLIYDVHGDTINENYLFKKGFLDILTYFKIFQAKIMENKAINASDYFITCSNSLKDFYISKGIYSNKVEVIINGVDTELFRPLHSDEKTEFIVTYAGGFQEWQGIDLLIESAEALRDENVIFRIIGFREENSDIKKNIKYKLGNKCDLIDLISREELVKYLNKSNILVIPRKDNEALKMAFPTKFAEYISTGKPLLMTNVSDVAKLVQKYNCGIVCEANSESLSENIFNMKNLNPKVLNEMGKNGRKLAIELLDKNYICNKYYEILKYWKKNMDR